VAQFESSPETSSTLTQLTQLARRFGHLLAHPAVFKLMLVATIAGESTLRSAYMESILQSSISGENFSDNFFYLI
jgi:hypothetical protein